MKKTNLRKSKGITLIALVITIIVLLILAGVAISMLSGENGILKKAAEAKTKTEEGQKQEEMALMDYEIDSHFIVNNSKYKCRYGFITGITVKENTVVDKVQDLQNALPEEYTVCNIDESEIEDKENTIITTGMAIQKSGKTIARTVVFGDVNCDGKFTSYHDDGDATLMGKYFKSSASFEPYQIIASDVNHTGHDIKDNYDKIFQYSDLAEKENWWSSHGWDKTINQYCYANKIENGDKFVSAEEIINKLEITNMKKFNGTYNEEDECYEYKITLNKTYTYKQLVEQIKSKFKKVYNITILDADYNEISIDSENNVTKGDWIIIGMIDFGDYSRNDEFELNIE